MKSDLKSRNLNTGVRPAHQRNGRQARNGEITKLTPVKTSRTKITSVSVIGLGYVGLPLACLCAKKGYTTYGIDIDTEKKASVFASIMKSCQDDGVLLSMVQNGYNKFNINGFDMIADCLYKDLTL